MLRVLHWDRFLVCLKKLAPFPLLDRDARFSPSSEVIDAAHPHVSHHPSRSSAECTRRSVRHRGHVCQGGFSHWDAPPQNPYPKPDPKISNGTETDSLLVRPTPNPVN